jgi:hypothetical protein
VTIENAVDEFWRILKTLEAPMKNASEKYPLCTLVILCLLVAWVAAQPLLCILAR